ncbi:SOUL family heme-binding protein [Tranquillimonas rosea]|uniref:SOUL family heme-binding protein n=1 Tax=Tranquillimonas rosea TaxID=641238 RepID=UPI003BAAE108
MAQILDTRSGTTDGGSGTSPVRAGYKGYEAPVYDVERQIGDVELRLYQSCLLAEITVRGSRDSTMRKGFKALAAYLQQEGAPEMTVPVIHQPARIGNAAPVEHAGRDELWTTSFVMPRGRDRASLPEPEDENIHFRDVPAERLAVLTFSGRNHARRVNRKIGVLERTLAGPGLKVSGPARAMLYDDPFTLPWQRLNEVALPLR